MREWPRLDLPLWAREWMVTKKHTQTKSWVKSRKIELVVGKKNNRREDFLIHTSHKLSQFVVIVVCVEWLEHHNPHPLGPLNSMQMYLYAYSCKCIFGFLKLLHRLKRVMLSVEFVLFTSLWLCSLKTSLLWVWAKTEVEQNGGPLQVRYGFCCFFFCSLELTLSLNKGYHSSYTGECQHGSENKLDLNYFTCDAAWFMVEKWNATGSPEFHFKMVPN